MGGGTNTNTLASCIPKPIPIILFAKAWAVWSLPVRLLQSSKLIKPAKALLRSELAIMSKPAKPVKSATSGSESTVSANWLRTSSLRSSDDRAGSCATARATPWSSPGTKLDGIRTMSTPAATVKATNKVTPNTQRRIKKLTPAINQSVSLSKPWLNHWNGFATFSGRLPSIMAHIAGVKVSATTPETTTETAIVTANWRYSSPLKPDRKATGANTATKTRVEEITAPVTCCMVNT